MSESTEDKQVPELARWAMETARVLLPGYEGMDLIRLAVGLIQARAMECRHISGKFAVGGYIDAVRRESKNIGTDLSSCFALHFSDRSARMEEFANQMAVAAIEDAETPRVVQ